MNRLSVFYPTFGNRPAQLVGRDEIVQDFVDGLKHTVGHPHRAMLLIGQRGMGKTALLLEFASEAEDAGYITARVTANSQMLEDIIGMIYKNGNDYLKKHPKIRGVSAGAFGFSIGLTLQDAGAQNLSFLNQMILITEELEKHDLGLVLLVDEVQKLSVELQILTTTFQHLVGEGRNIVLAMAGLPHAISSVLNDDVLTFFNRAHKVYLGPLNINAISVYYSEVFDTLGLAVSQENLETAACATRGYPYLLQLIGYYLLKYVGKQSEITDEMVSSSLTSARRDLIDNIFSPVLKPLSDKDRQFLKAMAKDVEESKITDIKTRMKASDATIQTYRKRLIDAGIIAAERRGHLAFIVPYLGEYLRGEI